MRTLNNAAAGSRAGDSRAAAGSSAGESCATAGSRAGDSRAAARSHAGITPTVARSYAGITPTAARSYAGITPTVARSYAGITPTVARSHAGINPTVARSHAGINPTVARSVDHFTRPDGAARPSRFEARTMVVPCNANTDAANTDDQSRPSGARTIMTRFRDRSPRARSRRNVVTSPANDQVKYGIVATMIEMNEVIGTPPWVAWAEIRVVIERRTVVTIKTDKEGQTTVPE